MKVFKQNQAFTLIEMILYIALSAIVLVAFTQLSFNIMNARVRVNSDFKVTDSARFVLEKVNQKITSATEVTLLSSDFVSDPATLTLVDENGVTLIIDTVDQSVNIGGQSVLITTLRMKEGAGSYQNLTSDRIDVQSFTIENLTRGSEPVTIGFSITLDYLNPDSDIDFEETQTIESAATLRIR